MPCNEGSRNSVSQNTERAVRDKPWKCFGAAAVSRYGQQLCMKMPLEGTSPAIYFCQLVLIYQQNLRLGISMTCLITARKPLCLYDVSEKAAGMCLLESELWWPCVPVCLGQSEFMPGLITNSAPFTLKVSWFGGSVTWPPYSEHQEGYSLIEWVWPSKSLWVWLRPCLGFGVRKWQLCQG